jgi:hypothetical protein
MTTESTSSLVLLSHMVMHTLSSTLRKFGSITIQRRAIVKNKFSFESPTPTCYRLSQAFCHHVATITNHFRVVQDYLLAIYASHVTEMLDDAKGQI